MNGSACAITGVLLALAGCTSGSSTPAGSNSISPAPTSSSASIPSRPLTPQDKLLLNSFVTFAVSPEAGTAAKLPFEPDGVRIGLASNLMESIGPSHVAQPAAWTLNSPAFRGGTGPFFPLKAIADHFAETGPDPTSPTRGFAMTLGEHPHCASGPVAPPEEVADMRHISIQPDENSIANCLEWFTVDLFVTKSGRIKAVTYDLWKP